MDFTERITKAIESSVLKEISSGNWLSFDYKDRVQIPAALVRNLYARVDMEAVLSRAVDKVEEHIADKIVVSLTTELGHDVKQIMSNKELREDLRGVIRAKLRDRGMSA